LTLPTLSITYVLARSRLPVTLVPVAEVFVYRVKDVDSDSWTADMALIAGSRQEALRPRAVLST
jgi:hypothetical protein